MGQVTRKPTLTPPEPASDAGIRGQDEPWPPEPKVWGSNPYGRASYGGRSVRTSSSFPSPLGRGCRVAEKDRRWIGSKSMTACP